MSASWQVAVIAGCFVLLGAIVALLSTWLSDRRKLRREDLRQWDKDLRDFASKGVLLASKVSEMYSERAESTKFMVIQGEHSEKFIEILDKLTVIQYQLALIAPADVVSSFESMRKRGGSLSGLEIDDPKRSQATTEFSGSVDAFTISVRRAIRLEHKKRTRLDDRVLEA